MTPENPWAKVQASQWALIVILGKTSGGLTKNEIAHRLGVSPQRITDIVRVLAEVGLTNNPVKRNEMVTLTDRGGLAWTSMMRVGTIPITQEIKDTFYYGRTEVLRLARLILKSINNSSTVFNDEETTPEEGLIRINNAKVIIYAKQLKRLLIAGAWEMLMQPKCQSKDNTLRHCILKLDKFETSISSMLIGALVGIFEERDKQEVNRARGRYGTEYDKHRFELTLKWLARNMYTILGKIIKKSIKQDSEKLALKSITLFRYLYDEPSQRDNIYNICTEIIKNPDYQISSELLNDINSIIINHIYLSVDPEDGFEGREKTLDVIFEDVSNGQIDNRYLLLVDMLYGKINWNNETD